jgi:hypothetical protein
MNEIREKEEFFEELYEDEQKRSLVARIMKEEDYCRSEEVDSLMSEYIICMSIEEFRRLRKLCSH